LRILQVGPLPPPAGGMAAVVENLSDTLAHHCEVRVLNTVKTTPADRSLIQGVVAQLLLLARLARWCLLWRPQIVHIHTCSRFSFWRSAGDVALARLLGRRVVLHIHGGGIGSFLDSLRPWPAGLARLTLRACTKVIVLGQGWKDILTPWCDTRRLEIVPNGVPVQPQRKASPERPFSVLCLASYDPLKGQTDLLRAAAILHRSGPIRVALLGPEARAGQRRALLDLAASLGLGDAVDIPGPVAGADKDPWWSSASCFCLPSYMEAQPMSLLEAMAMGLPVIATRVGSIPESVLDGSEGLLFEPGDLGALVSHLKTLRDHPALADRLGRAGRRRLLRDFTVECSVERLLSIYRKGIAPSGTSMCAYRPLRKPGVSD
jgi:glycosyltransferase involved in cell wall biosynthesis